MPNVIYMFCTTLFHLPLHITSMKNSFLGLLNNILLGSPVFSPLLLLSFICLIFCAFNVSFLSFLFLVCYQRFSRHKCYVICELLKIICKVECVCKCAYFWWGRGMVQKSHLLRRDILKC